MSWVDVLQNVGSICSAGMVIATVMVAIFKIPSKFLQKYHKEHTEQIVNQKVNEVKELIEKMNKKEEVNEEATRASLRHSITYIYEKYKESKILPGNSKKDLCSLYEAYKLLGGNSFIHEIYDEMMKWETK